MPINQATVLYKGRGVTSRVRAISPTEISLESTIQPTPGDAVTVFIDGVGRMDSQVRYVDPPRVDLTFLTDTHERWRQIQILRSELRELSAA